MTLTVEKIRSVLIVRGAFAEIYEPAWCRALGECGIQSRIFDSHSFTLPGIAGRVERRVLWGPGVARMRRELIAVVRAEKPDVTLFYQGHYFDAETLASIKSDTFVTGFHNDDPFGSRAGMLRYRHLLPGLRHYDGFHVYRSENVGEAKARGARRVGLLMSYFLPWMDYPRDSARVPGGEWECDLVFAGHTEPDSRVGCLAAAVRSGARTRIFGERNRWKAALPPDVWDRVPPIRTVVGEEYRQALSGAKIAACFFSKWNRDRYTRRSFEIPACGGFLLSERTAEMQEMFKEGIEAEYFSDEEEFVAKVAYYLGHEDERRRIAAAGLNRVHASGHDIHARMRSWLSDVERWREEVRKDEH